MIVKLRTKLLLSHLLIGILIIGSVALLGFEFAEKTITQMAYRQLTVIRETKKREIETYFKRIETLVAVEAADRHVSTALSSLEKAFKEIGERAGSGQYREALEGFYREMKSELHEAHINVPKDGSKLVPRGAAARALQYNYIVNNKYSVWEKGRLDNAGDGSRYSRLHEIYNPVFRNIRTKLGFQDIFLVCTNGALVYTVNKKTDFGTNLLTGPYASSSISETFRAAMEAPEGTVVFSDFSLYLPSYHDPAAFVASPVFDNGRRAGVMIFQLTIAEIDRVMTGEMNWKDEGLGETGETYLVGRDFTMRSNSRFLLEGGKSYLNYMRRYSEDLAAIEEMEVHGTSILLQRVDTEAVRDALLGNSDIRVVADYRGKSVLSSYSPVDIPGQRWAILSEMDIVEALQPLELLRCNVMALALAIAVALVMMSLFVSRGLTEAFQSLKKAAGEISKGRYGKRLSIQSSTVEIGELAHSFNIMAESVDASNQALQKALDEMESKVRQRTAELSDANDELSGEVAERRRVEVELRSAIEDKNMLMREVHHRVKNNLGVIQSLLTMQMMAIDDEKSKEYFLDARSRLKSMSMIHERLHRGAGVTEIEASEYIQSLMSELFKNYKTTGGEVGLRCEVEDMVMDVDVIIPLGLIINELVSNVLKYAFPAEVGGELVVEFSRQGDSYALVVSDDGVGLPEGFDIKQSKSLGMKIVVALVRQLGGELVIGAGGGAGKTTEFRISFPVRKESFQGG